MGSREKSTCSGKLVVLPTGVWEQMLRQKNRAGFRDQGIEQRV